MLQLFDLNHNKLHGLVNYKELKREKLLDGDQVLSFLYPQNDSKYQDIKEETYIRTKDNEYVIKEVNVEDDWTEFVCKINVEDIKGTVFPHFETIEQNCTNTVNLALAGTGWTIGSCDVSKLRTVRKSNSNSYDILQEIRKVYRCDFRFDSVNKKVYIYQSMGSDKGSYFTEELNLKKLNVQRNSYDYCTRIIPIGKDGLRIASINSGKEYVENYQYSNKIITVYWEDNRYTVVQSLKEDAEARLNELSKPRKSYKADIFDLARLNDKYKNILDYDLGDTITLLSKDKKVKDKQRIVKIIEYPDEPERNTCEIANRIMSLEDLQVDFVEATETVSSITTSDGQLDGSKLDSVDGGIIKNLKVMTADIQDLNVVTARIGTLESTKANITDLTTATARISTLEVNSATITSLNASNARITTLEGKTASIETILAKEVFVELASVGKIVAGSSIIAQSAIGSAQINDLKVDKLTGGTLDLSKGITIAGANSRLKISGNRLQVFATKADNSLYERVSLGDVNGDGTVYGFRVRGADGVTVLLDETGVKREGITDGSVNNAKIAGDANISGTKLDIASVVTAVNGGSTLIQSSKVFLNNSTLDVQFSSLNTTVTNQGTSITNINSSITALNNSIALKVDTQTYNTKMTSLDSSISTLNTSLSKTTSDISVLQGQISLKVTQTDVANYVASKGQNLITNGTGLLSNNTNFSSFMYDGSDSYYSKGSFKNSTYSTTIMNDELVPVDVDKKYKLGLWAKTNPHVAGARAFIGIICYDCDGNYISPENTMYVANTATTLSQDLKNGDTVVCLTSAANWNNAVGAATYQRKLIFWDYKNAGGYQYPVSTYSRHISSNDLWADGSINYTNNTITLRSAWTGGTVAAGTSLSQGSSGDTYKYITNCFNTDIPATWANYYGYISDVDLTGTNVPSKFSPGTANIKLVFLLNRNVAGSTTLISNIIFGLDNAAQKDLDSAVTRITTAESSITALNSSIALKVETSTFNSYKTTNDSAVSSLTSRVSAAELKITDSSIISTVRNSTAYQGDLNTKANQSSLDATNGRVSATESSITQLSTQIINKVNTGDFGTLVTQNATSVKTAVGQIGGNNLLKNGGFELGLAGWLTNNSPTVNTDQTWQNYRGKTCYISSNASNGSGIYQSFSTIIGKKYTVQFMLLVDGYHNNDGSIGVEGIWVINPKGVTSWTKFTYTFTATNTGHVFIAYANANTAFFIDDIQVEEGENATAWSPNANELKATYVDVNDVGLTVTNGALMVKNGQDVVVIDGQYNMHKIIITGTKVLTLAAGEYSIRQTVNHNLGYVPAFSAYMYYANSGVYSQLPYLPAGRNLATHEVLFDESVSAMASSSTLYFDYDRRNANVSSTITIKYFIYKEVAF